MAKSSTTLKPGQRPPGAGRPKGVPNKKTVEFQAILDKYNFSPGEELIYIYKEQMKIYEERKKQKRNKEGQIGALIAAQKTVNDICQYVYPKKKAIEHTGEVGLVTLADYVKAGQDDD